MQHEAHGPEEGAGLLEAHRLALGEDAALGQLADIVDLIEILGDPVERMEVAQAALALLDVGLGRVAGIAHALVALVALGELGLDEGDAAAGDQLLGEAAPQRLGQLAVAGEIAHLQDRRADGHVGLGLAQAFIHRAGRRPDLQAHIPEHVEHVLDQLLHMGRVLVGNQEQQIDVGKGRQLAAAIAADRQHRQPFRRCGIVQGIDPHRRQLMQGADQLIHQQAQALGRGAAVMVGLEAAAHFRPAIGQRLLEQRQQRRPRRRVIGLIGENLLEPDREIAAVDDRPGILNAVHEAARSNPLSSISAHLPAGRIIAGKAARTQRF